MVCPHRQVRGSRLVPVLDKLTPLLSSEPRYGLIVCPPRQVRGSRLVPVFDKLATDVSRWVRNSAFQARDSDAEMHDSDIARDSDRAGSSRHGHSNARLGQSTRLG